MLLFQGLHKNSGGRPTQRKKAMPTTLILVVVISLFSCPDFADGMPAWVGKESFSLDGHHLIVVCSGEGPAIDIARREANLKCITSAIEHLHTTFEVKSTTIESEKSIAFHQEITMDAIVKNLTCAPLKEDIEQSNSSFVVWRKCKFDLHNVTAVSYSHSEQGDRPSLNSTVRNKDALSHLSERKFEVDKNSTQSDERRILRIVSVPPCSDLLVRGQNPRIQPCSGNPESIVLQASDKEIIVRHDGFVSKTIQLIKGGPSTETIEVILEAH